MSWAIGIVVFLPLAGCNDEKVAAGGGGRSEVVLAKDPPVPSTPSPATGAHANASASDSGAGAQKSPRRICETELGKPARAFPATTKATFGAAAAAGAAVPDARLEIGAGRWTWINFFAAWCGPCKEEMPRLRAWEQKLPAALRVRFVSLDDDERQLGRFLGDQPATGVRAALWLKPGGMRDGFLKGLKLPESPSLPAHALVDPDGRLRCSFEGAIDEADYPQVESIVARR